MSVALIVAASENNVIGKDGTMPWHLPDDWKYFRKVTNGYPVIMGRVTYESIGKPLPGRRNIVITRQEGMTIEGCDTVHSLDEALVLAKEENPEETYIIGGGEIYEQAMPLANVIRLTRVHTEIEGGTAFFPEIGEEWEEVERTEHPADSEHAYAFSFVTYKKV